MATYYKPQSPIQSGEDFIYPITTADQIMKSDNSRLEQNGEIVADNSPQLGGIAASEYALKTKTVPTSRTVNGKVLSENIALAASDVGAVPTSRTVNGKALSSDISLSSSDVGALASGGTATNSSKLEGNTLAQIMLKAYPVGAIYISTSSTSPASLFGGTWEQLKDRFLLGAGGSYSAGGTGGEATHKLTTSETPAHSHTRGTMEITGTFTTRWDDVSGGGIIFPSRFATGAFSAGNSGETKWYTEGRYKTTSSNHNDKLSFTASKNWTGSTSSVGGNGTHNNMPPYLAVYMWKRVR